MAPVTLLAAVAAGDVGLEDARAAGPHRPHATGDAPRAGRADQLAS